MLLVVSAVAFFFAAVLVKDLRELCKHNFHFENESIADFFIIILVIEEHRW